MPSILFTCVRWKPFFNKGVIVLKLHFLFSPERFDISVVELLFYFILPHFTILRHLLIHYPRFIHRLPTHSSASNPHTWRETLSTHLVSLWFVIDRGESVRPDPVPPRQRGQPWPRDLNSRSPDGTANDFLLHHLTVAFLMRLKVSRPFY